MADTDQDYNIIRAFVEEIIEAEIKKFGPGHGLTTMYPSDGEFRRLCGKAWWGAMRRSKGSQSIVIIIDYNTHPSVIPWARVVKVDEILDVFSMKAWKNALNSPSEEVLLADPDASKKIADQFHQAVHKHLGKR